MEILFGNLHDTFKDENGVEIPYVDKVVAVLDDDIFKVASIPDFCIFEMSKEEFFEKVTDIKKGEEIW